MSQNRSATYKDAGVNIDEADRSTAKIKRLAGATFSDRVLTGIGSFGAAFSLGGLGLKDPVLISSADGVGTKLNVAFSLGVFDTVGQCLVNHCINDIAVQGARPLFFLDYFAVGQLEADVAEQVVRGLSIACKENGVALIGGETAEMPGMYRAGEFDLAGFIVGIADLKEMARASRVKAGDVLIGLPSSGLQTNGYSLARKLMFEVAGYAPVQQVQELGTTAGEELLKIHRSFLKPIRLLHEAKLLRGAAHITGGGITDNTPRMLPDGTVARVRLGSWPVLPVFELLRDIGHVADQEMLRTFNMGVGMIMAVSKSSQSKALKLLASEGEEAFVVGEVAKARRASSKPKVVYEK